MPWWGDALDESVRPIEGALAMAMVARANDIGRNIVPEANAREAAVVQEVEALSGQLHMEPVVTGIDELFHRLNTCQVDFADVRRQETAKRALVVAAGGHKVLML